MSRHALKLLGGMAALGVAATAAVAAPAAGPFTAAQADRGQAVYAANCAQCHGDDMSGGAGVPALSGPDFAFGYKGKPAQALFDKVSTQMPPGAGGSLSDQQYLDVISAIMRKNGAVPGQTELKPGGAGLSEIGVP